MTLHIRLIDLCLKAVADVSFILEDNGILCYNFTDIMRDFHRKMSQTLSKFLRFFSQNFTQKKIRRHFARNFTEISQTLSNFFCFLHRISQKILSNFIWFVLLFILVAITCISGIIFQDWLLGYGNHFCRQRLRVF